MLVKISARLEENTVTSIKQYKRYIVNGMKFRSQAHFIEWCVDQGMNIVNQRDVELIEKETN